nr:ABC transporter substrate-binding protein [Pseudacidovorax sp. NFM-22]
MHLKKFICLLAACGALTLGVTAQAQQATIGVVLSTTGPAASLGILEKNGVATAADQSAQKLRLIHVDDASDPSEATRLTRKLITEDKVDAIIGTTGTPGALAMIGVVAEGRTPVISLAPANILVTPAEGPKRWVFKTTTNDDHEGRPLFQHMKAHGVKNLAFVGFSDSYGEQWVKMSRQLASENQLQIVAEERYARTDTSVASQVLKIVSKTPDAVVIAASGGGAAMPLLELRKRGFKGRIYVTLGATFGDFIKLAGAEAEGIYAPFAAVMNVGQLPQGDPGRKSATDFVQAYEGKFGANTANIFAGSAWDAVKLLDMALPVAAKSAAPGTPEFREALRTALENLKELAASRGVYNTSPTDHTGLDASALRVGRYAQGRWVLEN